MYRIIAKLSLLGMVLAFVSACAAGGSMMVQNPTASAAPANKPITASNSDLSVSILYVITPDGQGSWVKGAKWNETVLTVETKEGLTLTSVSLLDTSGVYHDAQSHAALLISGSEMASRSTNRIMGSTAVTTAVGLASNFIPIPGAGFLAGIAMQVGMRNSSNGLLMDISDMENVQKEFAKRNLTPGVRFAEGASLTKSVFFPLGITGKELVVTYNIGDHAPQVLNLVIAEQAQASEKK